MRLFKLNKNYSIVCQWINTNYGFRHDATLLRNGIEQDKEKCCYYNRTWERYEYESVLHKLIYASEFLTDKQIKKFLEMIKKYK